MFIRYGDLKMEDSIDCCQWLEKTFKKEGNSLSTDDDFTATMITVMAKDFKSKLVVPCEALLKNQDPTKDEELIEAINKGLIFFNDILTSRKVSYKSPFYLGTKFSLFEVLIAPYLDRLRYVLLHYRGFDLMNSYFVSINIWMNAVDEQPSFVDTRLSPDFYIKGYKDKAGEVRVVKGGVAKNDDADADIELENPISEPDEKFL